MIPVTARNVIPRHDFVLLQVLEAQQSPGGIQLPQTSQEAQGRAVVVAVGPGLMDTELKYVPTGLKRGDQVLFYPDPAGEMFPVGPGLWLIRQHCVAAVVEESSSIGAGDLVLS